MLQKWNYGQNMDFWNSVLLQDSAIMLKELTQKSVLKRMSRILSRPSVAKVEKGLPIFQLQKKIKSFFNSFKSFYSLLSSRFFRWSTLFQSLENLGKMPPLHAVRFSQSSTTNNSIFFRPATILQRHPIASLVQKNPEAKQSWNIVEAIRDSKFQTSFAYEHIWLKIPIYKAKV